jgi:Ca2+-binding RTX toxin-like protein
VVSYDIADEHGATSSSTVTITVTGTNDAPVVNATQSVTTNEDTTLSNVAIGASDVEGDTLSYSLKSGAAPAHGSVSFNQVAGTFSYSPTANYNGSDSFTIVVNDGNGGTSEQVVNVTVDPVNDAAIANSDVLWVSNSTIVTLPLSVLMANDLDPDGLSESITGISVTTGSLASPVTLNPDGTFSFTTAAAGGSVAAPSVVTLTYTTSDGAGGTSTGTVTVNVVSVAPGNTADTIDLSGVGTYAASFIDGRNGADGLTDGSGPATLLGGVGNDSLTGNAGDDLLIGADGNDILSGGAGNDILRGGLGNNDSMDGGAGTEDLLDFSDGTVGITFTLAQSSSVSSIANQTGGLGNNDNYKNMEGVIGTNLGDTITGSSGNDILRGGGGNDTLNGAGGIDLLDFRDGTAGLTFALTQSVSNAVFNATAAGLGTDTYSNMEGVIGTNFADSLTGSASDDILRGEAGNDIINGGLGNDTITGGAGADTLTGGGGNDTFVFGLPLNNVDTITDYSNVVGNADIIDLRQILNLPAGESLIGDGYLRVTTTGLLQVDTNGAADDWVTIANINTAGVSSYTIQYLLNGVSTTASVTPVAPPVALDLDGDGEVSFVANDAGTTFDYGYGTVATAWVAGNDGILVRDANHDGQVTADEIVFAINGSDLEGLAVYDSNHDGRLSSVDANFAEFAAWQDSNEDGDVDAGELHTLTEAGIASISLVSDGLGYQAAGGDVSVVGTGSFTRADGTTGILADAVFTTRDRTGGSEDKLALSNATQFNLVVAAAVSAIATSTAAAHDAAGTGELHLTHDMIYSQVEEDEPVVARPAIDEAHLDLLPDSAIAPNRPEEAQASLEAQSNTQTVEAPAVLAAPVDHGGTLALHAEAVVAPGSDEHSAQPLITAMLSNMPALFSVETLLAHAQADQPSDTPSTPSNPDVVAVVTDAIEHPAIDALIDGILALNGPGPIDAARNPGEANDGRELLTAEVAGEHGEAGAYGAPEFLSAIAQAVAGAHEYAALPIDPLHDLASLQIAMIHSA